MVLTRGCSTTEYNQKIRSQNTNDCTQNAYIFPTLFKKTKTGAIQEWHISVLENTIITHFGQVGGAIQSTSDTISSGKSVGKANATTAEEQAYKEAKAKWEKQVKKGYVENIDDAAEGKNELGGVSPMLAHKFAKSGKKIAWPCFMQPKLDGMRCLAVINSPDDVTLWTRTRKPITSMPHIIEELKQTLAQYSPKYLPIVLDGELYNHDFKDTFEELISLARVEEPAEGHTNLQYHVYDMVLPINYRSRLSQVGEIFAHFTFQYIKEVPTIAVSDEKQMNHWYEKFLDEGYEGAMLRNALGAYEHTKSYNLQKVKPRVDDEFEIIGVKEGRGKMAGCAIFICKTAAGGEFDVEMDGPEENQRFIWNNRDKYIGKMLTVEYSNMTKTNVVPRFPVGKAIRDYE